MTVEKKAKELVDKMTKQYALICVDEIIKDRYRLSDALFYNSNYWQEVKTEIEKL